MPITFPHPSRHEPQPLSRRSSSYSLPSYAPTESSTTTTEEDEEAAMIQEEWEESLRQIEVVFSIVIIPTIGKWYGRRAAYWGE
ncbi:hypothetical protein BCR39DRAFT_338831 [Naematelia encephala]|uniref:Uncharacterized protein n=1 Tax=Naematelia encephala TaxID=71784 RepID=A0A1Y2ANX3_9TREE|nr:hypothetical protein BCR39DRAFT_338831 [Naematelia encephala]